MRRIFMILLLILLARLLVNWLPAPNYGGCEEYKFIGDKMECIDKSALPDNYSL